MEQEPVPMFTACQARCEVRYLELLDDYILLRTSWKSSCRCWIRGISFIEGYSWTYKHYQHLNHYLLLNFYIAFRAFFIISFT